METTTVIEAPNQEIPPSGLVCLDAPHHTLWNVYNALELMTKTIDDMVDDCASSGAQTLLKDCQAAIAYESDRVGFIMEQRQSDVC